MDSLKRGWSFLLQAWQMALADKDLLKPSIYAMVVGFIVGLLGAIPLGLLVFLFADGGLAGQVIMGIGGSLLVFLQFSVTYIFSAMTVYLVYGYLSEGDGQMEKAWEIVRRDWLDILSLAAASTLVNVLKAIIRGNRRNRNPGRDVFSELIDRVWTQATYLVLPAMVIEDINLWDGLKRATYIAKGNLLLIGVGMVGVGTITGIINFVLGFIGILLGLGIAFPVVAAAGESVPLVVIGVMLGAFVASIFFMAASVISSYTATAYHTCLYLWARDVERAGTSEGILAPAPLAAVLAGD